MPASKQPKYQALEIVSAFIKFFAGLAIILVGFAVLSFFVFRGDESGWAVLGFVVFGVTVALLLLAFSALIDLAIDCAGHLWRNNQLLEWLGTKPRP